MNESWAQTLTVVIGMFTLFLGNVGIIWWFRKESREDIKEFRKESREDWKMCNATIEAIRVEMKDFHERLIKIEMDRKK